LLAHLLIILFTFCSSCLVVWQLNVFIVVLAIQTYINTHTHTYIVCSHSLIFSCWSYPNLLILSELGYDHIHWFLHRIFVEIRWFNFLFPSFSCHVDIFLVFFLTMLWLPLSHKEIRSSYPKDKRKRLSKR